MKKAMERPTASPEPEVLTPYPACVVQLLPVVNMTDDEFLEFCHLNRDLRMERTSRGELVIMPPTGAETGSFNAELTTQLGMWAKKDGKGKVFDSSTGFRLPNTAIRSPDAAWVNESRWKELPAEERRKFLPLFPDFAIELRSPHDRLSVVKEKMQEYIENGTPLAWLIDPELKQVHVYRLGKDVEVFDRPDSVAGDPELRGFILDLREIWEPT